MNLVHRDPYVVLDIALDATFDEAKAAYRRLATIFHPDRFTDTRPDIQTEAEKQMRYLNQAWKTIGERLSDADEGRDRGLRERSRTSGRDRFDREGHDTAPEPTGDFGSRARHARTRERARTRSRQPAPNGPTVDPEAPGRDQFVRDAREKLTAEQAGVDDAERQAFVRDARERLRTEQDQSA